MRKLIGRAGPLLIFTPSRAGGAPGGSAETPVAAPGARDTGAVAREGVVPRPVATPTLIEKLVQAVAGTLGRRVRRPFPAGAFAEDLWDPAGVPGPLQIAIESRAQRVAWWLWAGGRR